MSRSELALLRALSIRQTLPWHAAARATALDDDALCDAVEGLLARGAVRVVRAAEPAPVALAITDHGSAVFVHAARAWRGGHSKGS